MNQRTENIPWSAVILKKPVPWFGHLLWLLENTPVRQTLAQFIKPVKPPIGRSKTTWLSKFLTT